MNDEMLYQKSLAYLQKFCQEIPERCVGSEGNRKATQYFKQEIDSLGWNTSVVALDAMDWKEGGAKLSIEKMNFNILVSPYSLGCSVTSEIEGIGSIVELEKKPITGKIAFLYGEIAQEQIMPKNFVFYNPEQHQKIIALLEAKQPQAIITATGRNAALAGGVYPFSLIEDGDFNIPCVYMTEEEGKKLLPYVGKVATLHSVSQRIPGKAEHIVARKGKNPVGKIVITAHIDAKKTSPGAIDNGTGVIVLLLLARLLEKYKKDRMLEIVPFNGEDYYGVPGQMRYLADMQNHWNEILLNINIDGAGYIHGKTAFSPFSLPESISQKMQAIFQKFPNIVEGAPWPQGDHSIFVQQGCPAIAVSSEWFINNLSTQQITHTPNDNPSIVDCKKVVEIAQALYCFLAMI